MVRKSRSRSRSSNKEVEWVIPKKMLQIDTYTSALKKKKKRVLKKSGVEVVTKNGKTPIVLVFDMEDTLIDQITTQDGDALLIRHRYQLPGSIQELPKSQTLIEAISSSPKNKQPPKEQLAVVAAPQVAAALQQQQKQANVGVVVPPPPPTNLRNLVQPPLRPFQPNIEFQRQPAPVVVIGNNNIKDVKKVTPVEQKFINQYSLPPDFFNFIADSPDELERKKQILINVGKMIKGISPPTTFVTTESAKERMANIPPPPTNSNNSNNSNLIPPVPPPIPPPPPPPPK